MQEAPVILNAVEQGLDPDKACSLAKLCTEKRKYCIIIVV